MERVENRDIQGVLQGLLDDSKFDKLRMLKNIPKGVIRPLGPADFKDLYLSISQEEGEDLVKMISARNSKCIVEFGTSFGISTLYLAQGARITNGKIVTSEIIESKALTAIENFKSAGVENLIEVRIGDALETLSGFGESIDLLLLDGWKDLYLSVFDLLEEYFSKEILVYVDNADMSSTQYFLNEITQREDYRISYTYGGKVALIERRL